MGRERANSSEFYLDPPLCPIGDGQAWTTSDDPERAGRLIVARVRGTSVEARRKVKLGLVGP